MLSFALVTDIHYGFNQGNKKGLEAPNLLDGFTTMAAAHRVDMIVNGGDDVSIGPSPAEHRKYKNACKSHFNKVSHILQIKIPGNHDEYYDQSEPSSSMDIKGFHIVAFRVPMIWTGSDIEIPQTDLDWLERDLTGTQYPAIVFNHIGFSNFGRHPTTHGSQYFPQYFNNEKDVHAIFKKTGNVILSIAGHRHKDEIITTPDSKLPYHITQQSLIRASDAESKACGAFSIYTTDGKTLTICNFGTGRPQDSILSL